MPVTRRTQPQSSAISHRRRRGRRHHARAQLRRRPGSRSACSRAAGSSSRTRSRRSTRGGTSACPISISTSAGCASSAARPTTGPGAAGRSIELDFEARAWVPLSGWPIGKAELEPYYRQAQELCQLGAYDYTPEPWLDPGQEVLPFDPAKLVSRVWQFSPPTAVRRGLPRRARGAANLDVLLHASVVEIATSEAGAEVRACSFATLAGKRLAVRAARLRAGLRRPREPAPAAGSRIVKSASASSTTWSAAASWSTRT